MSDRRHDVMLLPGAVLPAALAYGALLDALGDRANAVARDLQLYLDDEPPPGFALDTEVAGVLRAADAAGFERFHLVGYSAGGAVSLAFAAAHPDRTRTLALLEPAWAGNKGLGAAEQGVWREYTRIRTLPRGEMMPAFTRANLRPGVQPPTPPPGPPPSWMSKRPAGVAAILDAFTTGELDIDVLRRVQRPVYYALGDLSNPDQYVEIAERLAGVFDDFTVETFEDRHHFDPPHRAEPRLLAASLLAFWARAEAARP